MSVSGQCLDDLSTSAVLSDGDSAAFLGEQVLLCIPSVIRGSALKRFETALARHFPNSGLSLYVPTVPPVLAHADCGCECNFAYNPFEITRHCNRPAGPGKCIVGKILETAAAVGRSRPGFDVHQVLMIPPLFLGNGICCDLSSRPVARFFYERWAGEQQI